MGRRNLWAKLKLSKDILPTNSQKLQFLQEDRQSSCVELESKLKERFAKNISKEVEENQNKLK